MRPKASRAGAGICSRPAISRLVSAGRTEPGICYRLWDEPPGTPHDRPKDSRPEFAEFQEELVPDLLTKREMFGPGQHPFGNRYAGRAPTIMFNITAYTFFLISQFREAGGRIVVHEFHTPRDLAILPQNTIVNCTGYAAKALFGDDSLMPVRGQLARGITQPDVRYGIYYKGVSFVPRRDGRHAFRKRIPAQALAVKAKDIASDKGDQDWKLFALSFIAFFTLFYSFIA